MTCRTAPIALLFIWPGLSVVGCTHGARRASGITTRSEHSLSMDGRPAHSNREAITQAEVSTEVSKGLARSAYDIVFRLRPEFLQARLSLGPTPARSEPAVFIDDQFVGGLPVLSQISPTAVVEIWYVTPVDAVSRFGPRFTAGIIVVRTK